MAKNRYKVENNIIIGLDASYTAEEFYETDDNLQTLNTDGSYKFKISDGIHVERTQSEIESDSTFLNKYKKNTWKELFQLLKDNLFEIIVSRRDGGDTGFDFDDVTVKAKNFRDNLAGLSTIEEVDSAKESAITWAGLE